MLKYFQPRWLRIARVAVVAAGLVVVGGPAGHGATAGDLADPSAAARFEPASSLLPPLDRPPLDPPLRVTGSFGELRGGHFHAGLDFSTGGAVGRPVYASLSGHIERVRTSGAGYGRSLYLKARDGRLLVYAHLDQFVRPIAAYVDAVHDSTGQYEQDLWPEAGRFPVQAGELLGWSGRSGTLPPHLHFEVRRGDIAYNPLRAGIVLDDSIAPMISRVTLEPIDDSSWVNRSAAPLTVALGAAPDTVVLEGRARAIVEATDGTDGARLTMAPWSVALEMGEPGLPGAVRVECHLDSASWATDMAEADYLYDRGRITPAGRFSLMLWAPREFRPVVLAGEPATGSLGTLVLRSGEGARTLRIVARDVAGHRTVRDLVLRTPGPGERGPDPDARISGAASMADARGSAGAGDPEPAMPFEFVSLPERHLRVTYRGASAASHGVWFETGRLPRRPASPAGSSWTAILPAEVAEPGGTAKLDLRVGGEDAAGKAWSVSWPGLIELSLHPVLATETPPGLWPAWRLARGGAFENALAVAGPTPAAPATGELVSLAPGGAILPATLPLRRAASVTLVLPDSASAEHAAIFIDQGGGWEFAGREYDPATRRFSADLRRVGAFALLEDTRGPKIVPRRPPRHPRLKPYSRWSLEAKLEDAGSGIDPRASHFVVMGRERASEWDGEAGLLRWRPLRRPAPGAYAYEIVAVDRTGNLTRRRGTFVID